MLAVLSVPAASARDDDDDDAPVPPAQSPAPAESTPHALPVGSVRLSAGQQRVSGLAVQPLAAVAFQPEAATYGKVLDIQPLLDLRMRYRAALAEAEVAAAQLELAKRNHQRLSVLHQEDIVADRELNHAEAQWRADRSREQAAQRLMGEIRHEAVQAWGAELARLALDGDAALFNDLLSHRRALLLVALPNAGAAPAQKPPLFVARAHERAQAVKAEPIAPATRTDELVQGETWFYHAAGAGLRSGMRLHAWAPLAGGKTHGVAVPLSAVVWHAGKPWVYRRNGEERFARAEIHDYRAYQDGWFVSQGFAPGESIVTIGAQMLLSEEFRSGIPDEDDD